MRRGRWKDLARVSGRVCRNVQTSPRVRCDANIAFQGLVGVWLSDVGRAHDWEFELSSHQSFLLAPDLAKSFETLLRFAITFETLPKVAIIFKTWPKLAIPSGSSNLPLDLPQDHHHTHHQNLPTPTHPPPHPPQKDKGAAAGRKMRTGDRSIIRNQISSLLEDILNMVKYD